MCEVGEKGVLDAKPGRMVSSVMDRGRRGSAAIGFLYPRKNGEFKLVGTCRPTGRASAERGYQSATTQTIGI